jgi:hypothetical protein
MNPKKFVARTPATSQHHQTSMRILCCFIFELRLPANALSLSSSHGRGELVSPALNVAPCYREQRKSSSTGTPGLVG